MAFEIFPTITTCPKFSWKHKLAEVERLGLKAVSVFPTFIKLAERKKLYAALDKSKIQWVPHVHVRDEFEPWEFEFFWKRFKTRYFNHHENYPELLKRCWKYRHNLYIEFNYDNILTPEFTLKPVAGICIDFSHLWASKNRYTAEYSKQEAFVDKHGVGCNHLNGYARQQKHDIHYITDKHQLDYLREVPRKFFGKIVSLEMNNSITKQLEYKRYIEKMLK